MRLLKLRIQEIPSGILMLGVVALGSPMTSTVGARRVKSEKAWSSLTSLSSLSLRYYVEDCTAPTFQRGDFVGNLLSDYKGQKPNSKRANLV